MTGTIEFEVARPPAEVFAVLSDLERAPDWVPGLMSVEQVSPGPVGLGARFRQEVLVSGRREQAELEITEFEPPRRFAHRGDSKPARFSALFVLEPRGAGTLVRHEYAVELKGLFRLAGGAVEHWMKKNAEVGIEKLKRRIEHETGS